MAKKVLIGRKSKTYINTGAVTVGTTAVQISTSERALEGGVQIKADAANANPVWVGSRTNITAGTSDALDGYPLAAGEVIFLPAHSEAAVWMVSDAADMVVNYFSH
ncbi:MAG: hypothetical protein GY906_22970 [bacterium]|nr:hypothetical protein [bacterium]